MQELSREEFIFSVVRDSFWLVSSVCFSRQVWLRGTVLLYGSFFGQLSLIKKQKSVSSWWRSLDMYQLVKALHQIVTNIQTLMLCCVYTWVFSWRILGKNILQPVVNIKAVRKKICLRVCLADTSDEFVIEMVHWKFECGPWRIGKSLLYYRFVFFPWQCNE